MLHVKWRTKYSDADFRTLLAHSWDSAARYFYARDYSFDEPDEEEARLLVRWRADLKEAMPEKYRVGVHLISERGCVMGEHLYLVDGAMSHTSHAVHKECDTDRVLRRISGALYCDTCKRDVSEEELTR